MLYSLSNKPDIICITETRIADSPLINIFIPGYKFLHKNSPSIVGGVGVYICQILKYYLTDNYKLDVTGVEELWLEISGRGSLSNIRRIIGCIYRHPLQTNLNTFLTNLNKCLGQLNLDNKQYYILCDININMLYNKHQENVTNKYNTTILDSNNCTNVITQATRVTQHTERYLTII